MTHPYLLSHRAVLRLNFVHNHPIHSAHALSFRPINQSTKQQFFDLFDKGHCASSARHAYEQMLLLNTETDGEKQTVLADRAINPNVQDICRLFMEWRKNNYGEENGQAMFERLQHEVDQYNEKFGSVGGKAILQWYEADYNNDEDTDNDSEFVKKKKKERSIKPLILAIVTPLMARAHNTIQQAQEIVFCDSTASLDRFNTSVFILSTATSVSGIPLALVLTSDEREQTIHRAFETVKEALPASAFFGNTPERGPQIFMIDDSASERRAIEKAWPSAKVLLCTFHFLQRRWTWLYDGKHRIAKNDRFKLIKKIKDMVYTKSEIVLLSYYCEIQKMPEAIKYPHFLQHIQSVWEKRHDWAHCYRTCLPLRGHQTNNIAEAGIRILKELIFSRVKAYNLIQMFFFVTEILETYYQKKLISLANNRVETYIALRYQGMNSCKLAKSDIQSGDNGWYNVRDHTTPGEFYSVNTEIGLYTCVRGRDGSPCLHQAAIVVHFGEYGLNFVASMSSVARQKLAQIALGDGAIKDPGFYTSLHQESMNDKQKEQQDTSDFSGTHWNLITSSDDVEQIPTSDTTPDVENMCEMIDFVAEDLKQRLKELPLDEQLFTGTKKFVERYKCYSSKKSNAMLASALHKFGWTFGGSVSSQKFGKLRHGKRIAIQATAAGRRRKGVKRGKAPITTGRPTNHSMPVRNEPVGKRLHNLTSNIFKGQQNAGKW